MPSKNASNRRTIPLLMFSFNVKIRPKMREVYLKYLLLFFLDIKYITIKEAILVIILNIPT